MRLDSSQLKQHLSSNLSPLYVLVGDDFRFGQRRAGDYTLLDAAGMKQGFDVARMNSYEVHGLRVSSSAVREALAAGDMGRTAALLGRPYAISGRVMPIAAGRACAKRRFSVRKPSVRPSLRPCITRPLMA